MQHSPADRHFGPPQPAHRGLTEQEASAYIGMSRSFLRHARMDGWRDNFTPGPPFTKIGRSVRYLKDDLDAWLEAHRHD